MMKLNRKLFLCSLNRPEAIKAGAPQFVVEKLKPKAHRQNFNLKRIFFLSLCLTLCIGSFQSIRSGQLHSARLTVSNLKRAFLFYVPKNLSEAPKLVFVLHGSGMEAKGMQVLTGGQFDKLADEHKDIIVVYPQGYGRYWNDCRRPATFDSKKLNVDDVAFFDSMVKYFIDNYAIDEREVFATGYSNGAQMCFKLAKERPGVFKGFAAVAANLPAATNDDCIQANQPVSMLLLNGTADPINPYNGGVVKAGDGKERGAVMSTSQTVQYWLALDKGDTTSQKVYEFPDVNKSDKSTAVEYTYDCVQSGKKVVLLTVVNGGHIFMNAGFHLWPRVFGNVNKDINAPQIIMEFFRSLK
jgi:polyhydroxybutyrate depolymerase